MPSFVKPSVYWIGYQEINQDGLLRYLHDTGNQDFIKSIQEAKDSGLSSAEILCSVFSKLCYKSFTVGKNCNVTRTRDITDNLVNCFDVGHGSVFEHVVFNLIVRDCSRVFSHELVRHRVGVAFSQTSGRYCRLDTIPLVWDPILDPVRDLWYNHIQKTEDLVYLSECRLGLRVPPADCPSIDADYCLAPHNNLCSYSDADFEKFRWVPNDNMPFSQKKKLTSAIRRIAPNGQANEIGVSLNLRSLRHTMLMRTARVAEWEIRLVFEQIYHLLKSSHPLIFYGAKERVVDGILEVTGMKCQPYEKSAEMALDEMSDEELSLYLKTRPIRQN